jgi:hypothetical protein
MPAGKKKIHVVNQEEYTPKTLPDKLMRSTSNMSIP